MGQERGQNKCNNKVVMPVATLCDFAMILVPCTFKARHRWCEVKQGRCATQHIWWDFYRYYNTTKSITLGMTSFLKNPPFSRSKDCQFCGSRRLCFCVWDHHAASTAPTEEVLILLQEKEVRVCDREWWHRADPHPHIRIKSTLSFEDDVRRAKRLIQIFGKFSCRGEITTTSVLPKWTEKDSAL